MTLAHAGDLIVIVALPEFPLEILPTPKPFTQLGAEVI